MEWLLFCITTMFWLSSFHPLPCASDDRLMPGKTLSTNQTLISDDRTFVLGFFSPDNSTTRFYLGIWYKDFPQTTIVWVANRESPLIDSSGVLAFSNDSNLVIMDSQGSVLWASDVTGAVSPRGISDAVLRNSGNLVIRDDGGGSVLWQSFDHPTNTLLSGMSLQIDSSQRYVSWRSAVDPSPGSFSVGTDPSTRQQIFIWKEKEPYWRTFFWIGADVFLGQWSNVSYLLEMYVMPDGDALYMTLTASDGSATMRYTIAPNGQLQLLILDKNSKTWSLLSYLPNSKCESYSLCGPNGYCDMSDAKCKCFQGFEPKVWRDWRNGNFSGGCTRQKALNCDSGHYFSKLANMKLPDKFLFLPNLSISECQAKCSRNCSCTAYASHNVTLRANNISRCLIWTGDWIDLSKYDGGRGLDLYVRLVPLESDDKRKPRMVPIIASIIGVIILITCIFIVCKHRKFFKGSWKKHKNKWALLCGWTLDTNFQKELSGSNELGEGKLGEYLELPLLDLGCIIAATCNFSDSYRLGQGGFGKVYKGKLPGGQEIAVKRLSKASGQGSDEFKNEAIVISKLQHKNLVRLLGCCIEGEERILVYELMPNKSLDFFLFDSTRQVQLDWGKHFNIIKGISRGLLYLHHDSRLRIIHRDLKASNVLLDEDMNPKISDFGTARIVGGNQNQANTNRVVGTYGYMSPEYAMEGLFSLKSDVYSFGVLVLEIVSGCRSNSFHDPVDFSNLLVYAWKLWNQGKVMEFMDPSIADSCSAQEVSTCMHIGLLCVQDHPNDRPTMSSIILMLESESMTYPTPKLPTFTAQRIIHLSDMPLHYLDVFSINDVTITTYEGR